MTNHDEILYGDSSLAYILRDYPGDREIFEKALTELAELRRKADEADEYPDCENCRNTGHPWIDAGELSGYDRVYCDCEQGQAMKAEAELAELREDRERLEFLALNYGYRKEMTDTGPVHGIRDNKGNWHWAYKFRAAIDAAATKEAGDEIQC